MNNLSPSNILKAKLDITAIMYIFLTLAFEILEIVNVLCRNLN